MWKIEDGYVFNPLIKHWNEVSDFGGFCEHIQNERVNLFNRYGEDYWFIGSASKHLVKLNLEDPDYVPGSVIKTPERSLLYWGTFAIYKSNEPILDGTIWQAIPFLKHKEFPQFLDLLMGQDRQQRRIIDNQLQEIIEKYNKSFREFNQLEKIRNERKTAQEAVIL